METNKNVWIMEIKPELNFEVIGQVYVYQYLMQQDVKKGILKKKEPSVYRVKMEANKVEEINVSKEIRLAILCEEAEKFLKDFCDDKNIEVFCDRIRKIR